MRLEHPGAKLPEDLDRVCAHIVVVLDNENPLFAPPGVDAVLPRNLEISGLEPTLLNRCILRSDERSRRFGEPHRNAHGGDPLQRCAVKIGAPDGLDLKIRPTIASASNSCPSRISARTAARRSHSASCAPDTRQPEDASMRPIE
jgi:hypothetical protein